MKKLNFSLAILFALSATVLAGEVERELDGSLGVGKGGITSLGVGSLPGGDASKEGRGFSTLGLDWRGDCVDYDLASGKPPIDSVTTNFQIEVIDTADKFTSVMSMSASASMSYGIYSGDASASYFKRIVENSYSNYIAGKVTVYSEAANIAAKGLSKLGIRALRSGPELFHRTCGNKFATSVVYGGEFIFMLEIKSRDNAEYEQAKLDVSGSAGNFGSASGSFASSMERLSQKYEMTATIVRNGLRENVPNLTPAAIQQYALEFPTKITANGGVAMQAIRYGVRDYTALEPRAPTWTAATVFMDRLAAQYVSALRVAGDISYWLSHPDQFFFVSATRYEKIKSNLDVANRLKDILYETAQRCIDRPNRDCKFPSLPTLDPDSGPQRLIWQVLRVRDAGRVSLGVVPPGETRRVRFRGLWSPSGGTDWWIPPDGSYYVDIIDRNGAERSFPSPTNEQALEGERVEVHLRDNPYGDNFPHRTDPASAALY